MRITRHYVACLRCGTLNPEGRERCSKCDARLIRTKRSQIVHTE